MADRKIAEIHLEMYDTEKGFYTKSESNGQGIHTLALIANYLVGFAKQNGFNYKFLLSSLSTLCKSIETENFE